MKDKKAPDEIPLKLKARNAARGDVVIETNNLLPVNEFIKMYIAELKKKDMDISSDTIRMFAMGKELKPDLWLYSYDILNESTVQVMIKSSNN